MTPPYNPSRARLWLLLTAVLIVAQSSTARLAAPQIPHIDKVAHVLFFGLLATHLHLSGLSRGRLSLGVLLVLLFGLCDEIHQYFTPGREFSLKDLICDTTGALLAIGLLRFVPAYRNLLLRRLA